jgi:hypothetical protein
MPFRAVAKTWFLSEPRREMSGRAGENEISVAKWKPTWLGRIPASGHGGVYE